MQTSCPPVLTYTQAHNRYRQSSPGGDGRGAADLKKKSLNWPWILPRTLVVGLCPGLVSLLSMLENMCFYPMSGSTRGVIFVWTKLIIPGSALPLLIQLAYKLFTVDAASKDWAIPKLQQMLTCPPLTKCQPNSTAKLGNATAQDGMLNIPVEVYDWLIDHPEARALDDQSTHCWVCWMGALEMLFRHFTQQTSVPSL